MLKRVVIGVWHIPLKAKGLGFVQQDVPIIHNHFETALYDEDIFFHATQMGFCGMPAAGGQLDIVNFNLPIWVKGKNRVGLHPPVVFHNGFLGTDLYYGTFRFFFLQ